jgi:hypothetical protein
MSESFDEKLCEERKKYVDETLKRHEERLDSHSKKIDGLEDFKSRTEEQVNKVCKDLQGLTGTLKWFIGILGTGFLTLFLYLIELHFR